MSKEQDLIEDEELDLSTLPDDELVLQMHDDLYDGLKEEIEEGTNILLERGWEPDKILSDALVEGMRIVGIDFRDGILFVPEVLLSVSRSLGSVEDRGVALVVGPVVLGGVEGVVGSVLVATTSSASPCGAADATGRGGT